MSDFLDETGVSGLGELPQDLGVQSSQAWAISKPAPPSMDIQNVPGVSQLPQVTKPYDRKVRSVFDVLPTGGRRLYYAVYITQWEPAPNPAGYPFYNVRYQVPKGYVAIIRGVRWRNHSLSEVCLSGLLVNDISQPDFSIIDGSLPGITDRQWMKDYEPVYYPVDEQNYFTLAFVNYTTDGYTPYLRVDITGDLILKTDVPYLFEPALQV